MAVSIEMARLIKDQCVGGYSGHMASIPNNPVLASIFYSISQTTHLSDEHFADILIETANALKGEKK